eukprot:2372008-Ditylum_brightwellii.AAC.1
MNHLLLINTPLIWYDPNKAAQRKHPGKYAVVCSERYYVELMVDFTNCLETGYVQHGSGTGYSNMQMKPCIARRGKHGSNTNWTAGHMEVKEDKQKELLQDNIHLFLMSDGGEINGL